MQCIESTEQNLQSGIFFLLLLKIPSSSSVSELSAALARFAPSPYPPHPHPTPHQKEPGLPRPLAMTSLRLATFFFLHHKNSVTKDFYERCLGTACWHRNATPSLFVCLCAKSVTSSCSFFLLCFSNSSSVLRSSRTFDGFQLIHLQRLSRFVVEPGAEKLKDDEQYLEH